MRPGVGVADHAVDAVALAGPRGHASGARIGTSAGLEGWFILETGPIDLHARARLLICARSSTPTTVAHTDATTDLIVMGAFSVDVPDHVVPATQCVEDEIPPVSVMVPGGTVPPAVFMSVSVSVIVEPLVK